MNPRSVIAGLVGAAAAVTIAMPANAARFIAYVGTYTGPKSEGIHAFRFDTDTGVVEPVGLVAKTANPTFLAVHPDGRHLYAANEVDQWNGKPGGYVTAYRVDPATGKLEEINQQSTVGAGPCHLNVDASGRALIAANYGGGSVVSFPVAPDGSLRPHASFVQHTGSSVDPARQKEPHAHSANLSPDNRFVFVADLGLDKVMVYALDPARATLTPHTAPFARLSPGSGPRHLAWAPDGRSAYVNGEMLSTVTRFSYESHAGLLNEGTTASTLPAGFSGNSSTAEVRVHPNGRFVYVSNRGHDSIAVFRADSKGALTLVENVSTQGKVPRNFNLDPTGRWLWAANQDSGSVIIYSVDGASGHLKATGQRLDVGSPVCVRFVAVR